jgi:hypothetical protein
MLVDETKGDPNSVYAELSAYNWIAAVYSEIVNTHSSSIENWKHSLKNQFCQTPHTTLNNVEERKVYQKIFHGISLGQSIRTKYYNNYFYYSDLVGTISDFYYALYNLFNSISMARDIPENTAHGKNISVFHTIKKYLPYPFNINSKFDSSTWNGKNLINNDNFLY